MNTQKVMQDGLRIKGGAPAPALDPEWVTVKDVARRFSVSVRSVYRYVNQGTFPHPRNITKRKTLFNLGDVRAFFNGLPDGRAL